jgi:serine/threonine protein kinase
MKQIGEGGFAKVYSAIWTDGKPSYKKQDYGSWKKLESEPIKVALKKLNESQNMSAKYLNEVYFCNYINILSFIHIYSIYIYY